MSLRSSVVAALVLALVMEMPVTARAQEIPAAPIVAIIVSAIVVGSLVVLGLVVFSRPGHL